MSTKDRQQYQSALKELLGGRAVAYYPSLARKVGGVKAAVMICQLLYWNGDATVQKNDGWFYKSVDEMEQETGLTKVEQQTARKELEQIGVIEVKLKGIPRVWHYRVDWDALTDLLIGKETHPMGNPPNDEPESVPMSGEKPAQLNVLKITPEITTETTVVVVPEPEQPPAPIEEKQLQPPNIYRIYEQELGALTPMLAQMLDLMDQEYPQGWFGDAVKEAKQSSSRGVSLKYVDAILKRWKSEGRTVNNKRKAPEPVYAERW